MGIFNKKRKRIYLDYAAATPVRDKVKTIMRLYESDCFANPSSIHAEGVLARSAIEEARLNLARVFKVRPKGIVLTSSGTESNNLAILGVVEEKHKAGVEYKDMKIISTYIEHPSVQNVLNYLEVIGVCVVYMDIDEHGLIVYESLISLLCVKTVMVSFAYVNSEIGVVQEVSRLSRAVRAFEKQHSVRIIVHSDAAQAPLWLPCQLESLQVDILTLDAGKCYGPKGVGVLVMRHGVHLRSISYGGSQEHGLRPSTENTAGIIGTVEALIIAQKDMQQRAEKIMSIRDYAIQKLLQIKGVVLNGSKTRRVANNINISISGIESEFAVICLDNAGIACSARSACGTTDDAGSVVVFAMTGDISRSTSTVRFSLGEDTTRSDLDKVISFIKTLI